MPNPTNKLTYRHFDVQRDFSSLITLLAAVELADRDGEDVSEAALREQLTLPGHDLAQDRWVVLSDNPPQLVGYSVIFKTANDEHADIYVAVHPAWRRQSIGSELLARIVTRARQIRAHDLRSYATAQNHGSAAFLFKHGFHPVSAYTRMTVPGTRSFLVPNFPTGFEVRSYAQVQNREILREAMNRGYEGLWGHHHLSQEEMAAWFPQLTIRRDFFALRAR